MSAFPQELDNRVGITAFPASSRPLATTDAARCAPCVIDRSVRIRRKPEALAQTGGSGRALAQTGSSWRALAQAIHGSA